MSQNQTTSSGSDGTDIEHKLIESEQKPWSEGTIHIFWPSAVASSDDSRYVAWCREHAKGKLKSPDEVFPSVGSKIKNARNNNDLSRKELADRIDEEEQRISDIEEQRDHIVPEIQQKIEDELGLQLGLENPDRFCKTCIQNAERSDNIDLPRFLYQVDRNSI